MTPALLPVTQEDRDAAAGVSYAGSFVAHIRDGMEDDGELVQAFARHRISHWRDATHAGFIDGRALEIAQNLADEAAITDVVWIARLQIAAIEGIKSALSNPPADGNGWRAGVEAAAVECKRIAEQTKHVGTTPDYRQGFKHGAEACSIHARNLEAPSAPLGAGGEE